MIHTCLIKRKENKGFFFFFSKIQSCDVAKIGDHPNEDSSKFGYRPGMKVKNKKEI
jgi:hypothetical protein